MPASPDELTTLTLLALRTFLTLDFADTVHLLQISELRSSWAPLQVVRFQKPILR